MRLAVLAVSALLSGCLFPTGDGESKEFVVGMTFSWIVELTWSYDDIVQKLNANGFTVGGGGIIMGTDPDGREFRMARFDVIRLQFIFRGDSVRCEDVRESAQDGELQARMILNYTIVSGPDCLDERVVEQP